MESLIADELQDEANRVYDVKCQCDWWLSKVIVRLNMERILSVRGTCKRHGEVEAAHWVVWP